MSYLLEKITESNNLYWAWEKAKNFYKIGDIWFNELEVAKFEANLSYELELIKKEINEGNYHLSQIQPVPFPKSKDENGPRTRQSFWVSVKDQVTWLAVVNILGQFLDAEMPFWSYGNRLHISVFKDEQENEWRFGYYRNTTKNTYRKWTQSWPLYRRHITITTKLMTKGVAPIEQQTFDEKELNVLNTNDRLNKEHPLRAKYLEEGYWSPKARNELFWAGIDLEKFYPRIKSKVILDNFKKYSPPVFYEKDVDNLIYNLLSFKIDYSGWTNEQLDSIGLNRTVQNFDHLPTGLFVAGFLANLALLNIDKEIEDKLSKNKSVAHFRYVDDHVILATSFEELIQWIGEYEKILEKNNIGTTFNPEKTEPNALSEYYKHIGINGQDRTDDWEESFRKKENSARLETKLDPDFPSPLMTQTLAKVSKIAGTEFLLLDSDEEKSIISDIEHLLLTDFPDQELRKDTRVSFAATMLSTIVPLITNHTTDKYIVYKRVIQLNAEIEEVVSKLKSLKKGGDKEKVQDKLNKLKEELESTQKSYQIENENTLLEDKKLFERTIKLLLKAVRENHDKVRLWTRLLEFCFKSGSPNEAKIVSEITSLKESGEVNELSATFIHSLILQVVSSLLIQSIIIIESTSHPIKRKKRARKFIGNILSDDFLTYFKYFDVQKIKHHELISLDIFRYVSGTIIYLLNSLKDPIPRSTKLIKEYKLIHWSSDPLLFCKSTSYEFDVWSWWILNKIPEQYNSIFTLLWNKIEPRLDTKQKIDQIIVQRYPQHLSEQTLASIETNSKYFTDLDNEGWQFDIIRKLMKKGKYKSYKFLKKTEEKMAGFVDHIILSEWIEWTKEREIEIVSEAANTLVFDPRLSEWAALKIIKLIAEEIISKTENIPFSERFSNIHYFLCVHPNNFKIPKLWIQNYARLSWEDIRLIFSKSGKIEFRAGKDLLYDRRFSSGRSKNSFQDKTQVVLSGLGSILICLLSKSMDLPSHWNPIGHQLAWSSLYRNQLKNVPVSSYTRSTIDSCFSKRNIETQSWKSLLIKAQFSYDNDTHYDPPEFVDVKDFVDHINLCLSKLECQQLTVSGHQPRQLIPISLQQLKRDNHQENHMEDDNL